MPTALLALLLTLAPDPAEPGLRAERLYNGVDRVTAIHATPPAGAAEPLLLLLLDANGNLHAEPAGVRPGRIDLAAVLPDIWRLRRTAYLQLAVGDIPVGSALVLQPMLSRMVPVTEVATNPNGIEYTEVVRWVDEQDETIAAPPRAGDTPDPLSPPDDPWLSNASPDGRLMSGLRIYPERDIRLRTTHGEILVALRPDEAPNTAWNFRHLCAGGFYHGIPFHRVVPMTRDGDPFVIQAGDPTPSGSGGPGYWLPLEPSRLPHDFGVISMARDVDPDSAGSQIFFALSRAGTARLDGHYCSFGVAVDGAETILAIAGVELADVARGKPISPPVILETELIPAPPRSPGFARTPVRPPAAADAAPRAATPDRVPR
ncbi:MAG: peptidylprolyl isomerase [Phycisphaerales bacterium]|nr:peptidylprolyl isomerase [Phycisphaerae bacterium]NNF41457.1 peptidylprolyl isomerase [Phycisphaerales bacterium]NNM24836.1 peptidylprolyl isomerase [Phycisphaerales bacterium]